MARRVGEGQGRGEAGPKGQGTTRNGGKYNRPWQHLYDWNWRKYRLTFLRDNPLCAECARQGLVEPATVVHHIKPHHGDPKLFWARWNHAPSCKMHHDSVEQAAEKGNARPLIGEDGYPVDDTEAIPDWYVAGSVDAGSLK